MAIISPARVCVIVFSVLVAILALHFCATTTTSETFPVIRLSPTNMVIGTNPTTNSTPAYLVKPQLALPSARTPAPSLPIIYTQPSAVNLPSWLIKYVAADNLLHSDCIREIMADAIPRDRILPSSVDSGGSYSTPCASETSLPYHPWPF